VIGGLLEQRYRVDNMIARGGMSTVYRGLDTRLDRPVAIKVMDPQFSADRSFVERFEREARAAARLHHPAVVAVHDQGVERAPDGDHVFLVMELIRGGTLRDLIGERGTLPLPVALSVLDPILSALGAAHRAGLIHRDIKPENVLISEGGEVKVADFGLVRAVASAGTTSDSMILGTVAYLSPEQVTTGASDARSDVYSAGVLLYEMLTGVPPYTGDTPISVAYRHVNDDVPAPSARVPGLPAAVDELVQRATRRDPAQRPADATAFLADVQRVREALHVPRVPVPAPSPGGAEKTVRVQPVRVGPLPDATMPVLMPVPLGPQGTRAMPRADFAQAAVPGPESKPRTKPRTKPEQQPPADRYEAERRRSRRTFVTWISIVLVLAAVIGLVAWWMGSGRWTAVPQVTGRDENTAVQLIEDASLSPLVQQEASDTVPSGQVMRTDPAENSEILRGEPVRLVISRGRPVVPPIRAGVEVADAQKEIEQIGLKTALDDNQNVFDEQVPAGKVVSTNPKPGTPAQVGGTVVIVLSKGPSPKPVPNVAGKTRDEAFAALSAAGFQPVDGPPEFSDQVEGGRVVRTTPAADTNVTGGDKKVTVIVSSAVTVPDVKGRKLKDAKKMLEDLGLKVEAQQFGRRDNATIFNQSVPGGSRVQKGSQVILIAL
jgi:serine/threonine-protein kinase